MDTPSTALNAPTNPNLGTFTDAQNRAILIAGLACSCVSLVAALVTLRWFLLMRRLFRHRLVMYLIASDFFKAIWYFIFPIVAFARGPVQSSSAWCQASGFLIAFAIEASDTAILLIALHAMLYIFRPSERIGKGGLYRYRNWTPIVWLGPPLIAASLAFINNGQGYVTAGNFCYLPKRPIWYRLALSYIPRYIVLITIFGMYAAISVYVHVKFRSFKEVVAPAGDTGSQFGSELERSYSLSESIAPDEIVPSGAQTPIPPTEPISPPPPAAMPLEKKPIHPKPNFTRAQSYRSFQKDMAAQHNLEPWDAMNFITSKPLQDPGMSQAGVQAADFAPEARASASSEETKVATGDSPTQSQGTKINAQNSGQTSDASGATDTNPAPARSSSLKRRPKELIVKDPLQRARIAIRNQLRFLFIYPAVYALMWAFPFALNCTLYSNYYTAHPIFWLQIVSTCALSLQAAVDCLVFSWREKPWRRVDQNSKFSIPFWRQQSVSFMKRLSSSGSGLFSPRNQSRKGTTATEHSDQNQPTPPNHPPSRNWWEEEGKKRKDSVWMGTDLLSKFTSRQSDNGRASTEDKLEAIAEHSGSV